MNCLAAIHGRSMYFFMYQRLSQHREEKGAVLFNIYVSVQIPLFELPPPLNWLFLL
uniref:Uncharacterized protein n=1 Tax=Anguilla anguilla TaxID=7936 RepID=A0A0E9WTE9_ANGAN